MEAARRTPCPRRWGTTALLIAFLCTLTPQASPVPEWNPGPKTTPDTPKFGLEGSSGAPDHVLARSLPDSDQEPLRIATTGQEEDVFVENQAWKRMEEEQSSRKPPVDSPNLVPAAGTAAATLISADGGSSLSLAGGGIRNESNGSTVCLGCSGGLVNERLQPDAETLTVKHEGILETPGVLGRTLGPVGQESIARELGGTNGTAESQEDLGSGDHQHLRTPAVVATLPNSIEREWSLVTFLGSTATLLPSPSTTAKDTGMAREPGDKSISPDSAETDHLLQVFREAVLQSPTPSGRPADPNPERVSKLETSLDPEREQHLPSETWEETASSLPAQSSTDLTLPDKEMEPWTDNTPPPNVLKSPEPPSKKLLTEIIDADYYDLSELDGHSDLENFPDGDSTKTTQDKKKSSWATSDLYNDFITFDESDFYPTTSFYTDGDEEGGIEDDEEEDTENEDGTIRKPGDEDDSKLKTFTPKIQMTVRNEKPTSVQQVPQQTFITSQGELHPKSNPETMKEPTQTLAGSSNDSAECRSGYLRHNRTCKSVCDIYPTYCYNGGQCYLVENSGAFCRCNTQDYIWHKGVRCESIITDFQVMCVAVGTAALVVLLLFMMTVFFAKKLYLLKTENYKLRKRKYRTPSELHNDNFSLSTIAEGSHPNVRKLCDTPSNLSPYARALAYYDNVICQEDPNAIHKLQEPTKSFAKDEEPFNIQNALSPKHDSDTSGHDCLEVNCLQNNLT
ncbi:chondroitin sulfate proteoglycan 5 isoform X2 [Microcaecilia unicolor]|uniref:Chondroitin sulfate proteoglycan 5 isoform X2 n=1 Tax=Microcaecilia unicolor TaxID=1415580 RepID=A0A6P7XAA2_9AMPH|nr:chondroitin sulfate proteoglycan 5 isoform X2 [Microcaecilia unicolor]